MIRLKHLLAESLATDPEFREKVKDWEGKVTDNSGLHIAYDDATMKPVKTAAQLQGVITIGYGTTKNIYPELKPGMKISEKTAEALLTKGIQKIESAVKNKITNYDSYPKYVQMAIMNAAYRGDLGPATIKLMNQDAWSKVSKEYLNHSNYTNPGNMRGVVARMKGNADAFDRYAKERLSKPKKNSPVATIKRKNPAVAIGKTVYPRKTSKHDFANVRNEPVINNGLVSNIITTVKWPEAVGIVKTKKIDDQGITWYYVELPWRMSSSYKYGWVRYDVVTDNKKGK